MADYVMDSRKAMQFEVVFSQLGWIDLKFPETKKTLLARLSPRIDTAKEVVIISTFTASADNWMNKVLVNNLQLLKASLLVTDRRFIVITSENISEFPFSGLKTWARSGYNGITGNYEYKITNQNNSQLVIGIHAKSAGVFAAIAGFWVPMAQDDMVRGMQNVEAMVQLTDQLIYSIFNTSETTLL